MQNFEMVRSWSEKYPYLGIPLATFHKLDNWYTKLMPKVESMIESSRLHNHCLPKTSSRPKPSRKTKRCVPVETASRNSGPTPLADGDGTRGWLGELSKDSETALELSRSLLLLRRSFEHSIREDYDYTAHLLEVQERVGNPNKDKLNTNDAHSPKIGIVCRSEKGPKPSLAPTKSTEPIKCNSEWPKLSISGYSVFHGRGFISTMLSNPVTMPSHKPQEASTCGKVQRLELVHCGLKDSGLAEEHVLEALDLAVISCLKDLSREELSSAAQAVAKESLLPTCRTVLLFEVPTLKSEDAEFMYEPGRFQNLELECGGPDSAGKLKCDANAVQRTTIHEEPVACKSSANQSLGRADTLWLIYLTMSGKNLRQVKTSSSTTGLAHAQEFIVRQLLVRGKCRCGAKQRP